MPEHAVKLLRGIRCPRKAPGPWRAQCQPFGDLVFGFTPWFCWMLQLPFGFAGGSWASEGKTGSEGGTLPAFKGVEAHGAQVFQIERK